MDFMENTLVKLLFILLPLNNIKKTDWFSLCAFHCECPSGLCVRWHFPDKENDLQITSRNIVIILLSMFFFLLFAQLCATVYIVYGKRSQLMPSLLWPWHSSPPYRITVNSHPTIPSLFLGYRHSLPQIPFPSTPFIGKHFPFVISNLFSLVCSPQELCGQWWWWWGRVRVRAALIVCVCEVFQGPVTPILYIWRLSLWARRTGAGHLHRAPELLWTLPV